MFRSTKSLEFALKNRHALIQYQQSCVDCREWFAVPIKEVRAYYDKCVAAREAGQFGLPFGTCECAHCGKSQILILPGKYDAINARRPHVQRYTFGVERLQRRSKYVNEKGGVRA